MQKCIGRIYTATFPATVSSAAQSDSTVGEAKETSPATIVRAIRTHSNWLPDDRSWWFGWRELEISLPGALGAVDGLPAGWDVLHLFSPCMELRWLRRGPSYQAVLLCEKALPAGLTGWLLSEQTYEVAPERRLLWGDRLPMGGEDIRGTVQLPRRLHYGLAGESTMKEAAHQSIVADCLAYRDAEYRLRTVRYVNLRYDRVPTQEASESAPTQVDHKNEEG